MLRLISSRPHAGRVLIGALAGGLLAFGQAGILPAGATLPPPTVSVVYASHWDESFGGPSVVHIFGRVRNDTTNNVALVQVNIHLFDATNTLIKIEPELVSLDVLGPGELAPFEHILAPPPPAYDHFSVGANDVTFTRASASPDHANLHVAVLACASGLPAQELCGTVTNNGSSTVENVRAVFTFLNGSGVMVATNRVGIDQPGTLAPGASASFGADRTGDPAYASLVAVGEPDYPIDLNPASLDFGKQLVTSPSPAQGVTIMNNGGRALAIQHVAASSTDFPSTSHCPSTLAAGQSCSVDVVFTPSVVGPVSGFLLINNDGAGSPDSIPLSGTGIAPIVSLAAGGGTTDFGSVDVGASSPQKPITLTNVGTAPLTVTAIATTGDFWRPQPGACLGTLAIQASCVINVVFTPGRPGTRDGSLTLTDNALDNPQHLALTGFGVGSAVTLSPSTLNFGDADVVISDMTVTLANNGTGTLTITNISTDGPFSASSSCGTLPVDVASGGTCAITVTFLRNIVGGARIVVGLLRVDDTMGTTSSSQYALLIANPIAGRGPTQFGGNPPRTGPPPAPAPKS